LSFKQLLFSFNLLFNKRIPLPMKNITHFLAFILFSFCLHFNVMSQHVEECLTDTLPPALVPGISDVTLTNNLECFNDITKYMLYVPEHTPIKFVNLDVHVFNDDYGKNNFPDTQEARDFIVRYIESINTVWAALDTPRLYLYKAGVDGLGQNIYSDSITVDSVFTSSGFPYSKDSRIRYKVGRISFHNLQHAWESDKGHNDRNYSYLRDNGFLLDSAITIIMHGHSGTYYGNTPIVNSTTNGKNMNIATDIIFKNTATSSPLQVISGVFMDTMRLHYLPDSLGGDWVSISKGGKDCFIYSRLYSGNDPVSGTFEMKINFGGKEDDMITAICMDDDLNIYATGYFKDSLYVGTDTLISLGGYDIYVCKFDQQGNFLWALSGGGVYDDFSHSIAIDHYGLLYIGGSTGGYQPSPLVYPQFGSISLSSMTNSQHGVNVQTSFISRLDTTGMFVWVEIPNLAPGFDEIQAVTCDDSGHVYVGGNFSGQLDYVGITENSLNGTQDMYFAKFDSTGTALWLHHMEGDGKDELQDIDFGHDPFGAHAAGFLYYGGSFEGTIIPNADVSTLYSFGGKDAIIGAMHCGTGTPYWVRQAGGSGDDEVNSISVAIHFAHLAVTGTFEDTLKSDNLRDDFSQDMNEIDLYITSMGGKDVFVNTYLTDSLWDPSHSPSILPRLGRCLNSIRMGGTLDDGPSHIFSSTIGGHVFNFRDTLFIGNGGRNFGGFHQPSNLLPANIRTSSYSDSINHYTGIYIPFGGGLGKAELGQRHVKMTSIVNDGLYKNPGIVSHELAHLFNLTSHMFETHYYPDLTRIHTGGISNNLLDYTKFNFSFSPYQIASTHSKLSINNDYRKVLIPDYCTYHPDSTITISSDSTYIWESTKMLLGDLVLDSAATLTIRCNVSLPEGASVIVKRGAKLVLDGGVLTNFCGNMWRGVQVWGTTHPPYNAGSHGKIEMLSGAVIENAVTGVYLIKADHGAGALDYNYMGGLISAKDSEFKNNGRSIGIMAHSNAHNNVISNNTFMLDHELNDSLRLPYAHISIWGTDKLWIRGNEFNNKVKAYEDKIIGIHSIDAAYTVDSSATRENLFENLAYGIYVDNFNATKNQKIDGNRFVNVWRGVELCYSNYSKVTRNDFRIRNYDKDFEVPDPWCGTVMNPFSDAFGLHLYHSSAYLAEGNSFTSHDSLQANNYGLLFDKQSGVIVTESGHEANEVYRNDFGNLLVACKAQGENRDNIPSIKNLGTGLVIKCNKFKDEIHYTDIGIPYGHIALYQGNFNQDGNYSSQDPAGNQFLNFTLRNDTPRWNHIWYAPEPNIFSPKSMRYVHHEDSITIPGVGDYNQAVIDTINSRAELDEYSCMSSLSGVTGIPLGPGAARGYDPEGLMAALTDSINIALGILQSGDQEDFLLWVEEETPEDLLTILEPYFSWLGYQILEAIINKAELDPDDIYGEILIANSPLPIALQASALSLDIDPDLLYALELAQTGISERDSLYALISAWATERDRQKRRVMLERFEDTDSATQEEIHEMLSHYPTLTANLDWIDHSFGLGNYTRTRVALDSLELRFPDWSSYVATYHVLVDTTEVKGNFALTAASADVRAVVESFVSSGQPGHNKFRGFLNLYTGFRRCNEIALLPAPPASKSGATLEPGEKNLELKEPKIQIFPNPFTEEFMLMVLTQEPEELQLSVFDLAGRIVLEENGLLSNSPQHIILKAQPEGIYFVRINSANWQQVVRVVKLKD
jgi:hypothetical protein